MDPSAGTTAERSPGPPPEPEGAGGLLEAGSGFIGNAGITLVGLATGGLLTMGNEVLAARVLGVSTYGAYALAMMLAKSSEIIAEFGVPLSLIHFLPIKLSRGDRNGALGAIFGSLPVPLAIGFALALLFWLAGNGVVVHLLGQPGAAPFVVVLGLAIPLMVTGDVLGNIARGFGRALPYVVICNLVPQLCTAFVLISLMVWPGPDVEVAWGRVFGLTVGVLVGFVFTWHLVRRRIGWARPVLRLRQLYGYALPLGINQVVALGIGWTDLFLLGLMTDVSMVGTYRGCMQIVLVFDLGANAAAAAFAPVLTVLIADARRAPLQAAYATAVHLQMLFSLPLLLIIIVNAPDLLRVLGPDFAVGAPALVILACGQFAKGAFSPATVALIIGGRQKLETVNVAVGASANLLLNLTLIPAFGLSGAAAATATSLIGLVIARGVQVRRIFGVRTLYPTLSRAALITLPLALAIWAISVALDLGPGSGFAALLLRLIIMAAVIGVSIWFFCLKAGDRAMLLGLALRRLGLPRRTRAS